MASMIAVRRAAALTAMLALAAGGCGTTATITNRDGTRYEVEIVRSTPSPRVAAARAAAAARRAAGAKGPGGSTARNAETSARQQSRKL